MVLGKEIVGKCPLGLALASNVPQMCPRPGSLGAVAATFPFSLSLGVLLSWVPEDSRVAAPPFLLGFCPGRLASCPLMNGCGEAVLVPFICHSARSASGCRLAFTH